MSGYKNQTLDLPHCRQALYQLSYSGCSNKISNDNRTEWSPIRSAISCNHMSSPICLITSIAEYDYRPNIGRHEVLVRSSPYPYDVNILFNIFTLSQEKSTESFRFCNNCAVLLVRSSHQQEKSIVLPFLWMFICWKISSMFLSSYLKRGTKRGQKC